MFSIGRGSQKKKKEEFKLQWQKQKTFSKTMFCQSVPVSASISVGYETLRMRSQDSDQCPSKTIMHYTYICLHVGYSSFTFWNIATDIGPIFLSKLLIIVGTHLIKYCLICIHIVMITHCFSGTPVRFWEGKILVCAGIVEKKETWIFSGNRSELMNLLLYGALLTKCTMSYSLCLSLMWMIYHPQS